MREDMGSINDLEDGALNLQFGGQPPFGAVSNYVPGFISNKRKPTTQSRIRILIWFKQSVSIRIRGQDWNI